MELEEAIRRVLSFQTEYVDRTIVDEEELKETDLNNYAINMVTYTLETSIPRAVVKDKIEELDKIIIDRKERTYGLCITIGEDFAIRVLQEILNEGE